MPEEFSRRFGSRYALGAALGRGAMGTVYRSQDVASGDLVAIKLLHPHLAGDPEVINRFLRERLVLSKISHPAVVDVFDMVVEGDDLGIVMELVEGVDLREVLKENTTIAPGEVVRLSSMIAEGLVVIHSNDVVHRDLKPANIILDSTGGEVNPKISDFGVARLVGKSGTTSTAAIGTPLYMAPEAVDGSTGAKSPADIYALGIMIFEMLVGFPPFTGENPLAVLMGHSTRSAPRIGGIPQEFSDLIDSMLAKDPADRPDASESYRRLNDLIGVVTDDYQPVVLDEGSVAAVSRAADTLPEAPDDATEVVSIDFDQDWSAGVEATEAIGGHAVVGALAVDTEQSAGSVGTTELVDDFEDDTVYRQNSETQVKPIALADKDETKDDQNAAGKVGSNPRVVLISVAGLLLTLVAGGLISLGLLGRNEAAADDAPPSFAFAPIFLDGDAAVWRTWSLSDDGQTLSSELEIENNGGDLFTGVWVEVIPKTVARNVDDILFEPPPDNIVETDPVVSYLVIDLGPDETWTASYSVTFDDAVSTAELAEWAADQVEAEKPYLDQSDNEDQIQVSEVQLASIDLSVPTDTFKVGEIIDITVEGTLTSGARADSDLLDAVILSSSNADVVAVHPGLAVARSEGSATVTAAIGDLVSSVDVLVEGFGETSDLDDSVAFDSSAEFGSPGENFYPELDSPAVPVAPTSVLASASGAQVVVTWASDQSDVDYIVTVQPGGQRRVTSRTRMVWSGLERGTYYFTVQAANEAGESPKAVSESVQVGSPTIGFSRAPSVSYPSPTSALVSFATPLCTAARYFGDFSYETSGWPDAGAGCRTSDHSHLFSGLAPGRYTIQVTVRSRDGQSLTSDPVTITIDGSTVEECEIAGPRTIVVTDEGLANYSSACTGWRVSGLSTATISESGVLRITPPAGPKPDSVVVTVGSGDAGNSTTVALVWSSTPSTCSLVGPSTIDGQEGVVSTASYSSNCTNWTVSGRGSWFEIDDGVLRVTPNFSSESRSLSVGVSGPGPLVSQTVTVTVGRGEVATCSIAGPATVSVEPGESIRAQYSSSCRGWSVVGPAGFSIDASGLLSATSVASSTVLQVNVGSGASAASKAVSIRTTPTGPSVTDPPGTNPSVTNTAVTNTAVTNTAVTEPSLPTPSVTEPTVPNPSVTEPSLPTPSVTNTPVTNTPVTEPPATESSVTTSAVITSSSTTGDTAGSDQ